jgi:hypothetical protein
MTGAHNLDCFACTCNPETTCTFAFAADVALRSQRRGSATVFVPATSHRDRSLGSRCRLIERPRFHSAGGSAATRSMTSWLIAQISG